MLDEKELLIVERKLSLMNIIIAAFLLMYFSLFYWFNYRELGINAIIFSSIIILFSIEFVLSRFNYFQSDFLYKILKFSEMVSCAAIAFYCGGLEMNILIFGTIYGLVSLQSAITYDITENYSKIAVICFDSIPMAAVILCEIIINGGSNFLAFLFILFLMVFGICQFCFIDSLAGIVDKLYFKINSLNGIAATNQEENDIMKANQTKLLQANEQLSLQRFKLQKANEQITRNNMEMQLQNSITKNFTNSLDIDNVLKVIVDTVAGNLKCDLCNIGIICHEDNEEDVCIHYSCYSDKSLINADMLKKIENYRFVNECYDNMAVIDITDLANIKFEHLSGSNIKSLLITPVLINDNSYCIYVLGSCKKNFFSQNKTFLNNLGNQITLSISNSLLYMKMKTMAIKDPLTGIYNRRYFNGMIKDFKDNYIDKNKDITVVLFDIDKFKKINDNYGHVFGDEVISFCGRTANKYAREYDGLPVRYGGEEFVIVFTDKDALEVKKICDKIHEEIKQREFEFGKEKVFINISIGIASYPTYCSSFEELVNAADSAMYSSKKNGRGRITVYEKV